MGPYAGVDLAAKLVEQCEASRDQDFVPFVLSTVPTSTVCRSGYLSGREKVSPANGIFAAIKELAACDVDVVGIPCNTAYVPEIFDEVKSRVDESGLPLRLLHIVDEVMNHLSLYHQEVKRVGVLSTLGTRKSKLYSNTLETYGYTPVDLADQDAEDLHEAIHSKDFGIKKQMNPPSDKASQIVYGAMDKLYQQGAQLVILACTELPLVVKERHYKDITVLDATLVLARGMITAVAKQKLKPWR